MRAGVVLFRVDGTDRLVSSDALLGLMECTADELARLARLVWREDQPCS